MNRQWVLAQRPVGMPRPGDFAKRHAPVPAIKDGEVLVTVLHAMMDPAIRNFLNPAGSYMTPLALDSPIVGMVLGRVEQSASPLLENGMIVSGFGSWSDYVAAPAARFSRVPEDLGNRLEDYTHPLGSIGATAHHGLLSVGGLSAGETVLVSACAGAVGSLVGQIAKIKGAARVVGIAGGPEKCRRACETYGYDLCIDYKETRDLSSAIKQALPQGVDVYFENVGGAMLQGALDNIAKNARIVLCGLIAGYNALEPLPGPSNLWNLVVNTAQIKAFRVADILPQHAYLRTIYAEMAAWIKSGQLRYKVDVREGFDVIPASFGCLFTGAHDGRLIVKVND
jgi:NADPH-dependent curcumin reductase CurA